MKVRFILDVAYLIDELKLHLVVDIELLISLADLHFEVVVCFFNFNDVHLLQLNLIRHFHYLPSSSVETNSVPLLFDRLAATRPSRKRASTRESVDQQLPG